MAEFLGAFFGSFFGLVTMSIILGMIIRVQTNRQTAIVLAAQEQYLTKAKEAIQAQVATAMLSKAAQDEMAQ